MKFSIDSFRVKQISFTNTRSLSEATTFGRETLEIMMKRQYGILYITHDFATATDYRSLLKFLGILVLVEYSAVSIYETP